ncbi:MAG: hypothetical protein WDO15_13675 [Bacteroidota bacterium]
MTVEQEEKYEEAKAFYRNKILEQIDKEGINNSRFMILEVSYEAPSVVESPAHDRSYVYG